MKAFLALCFVLAIGSSAALNTVSLSVNDTTVYTLADFLITHTEFDNVTFFTTNSNYTVTANVSLSPLVENCNKTGKVYGTLTLSNGTCYELATNGPNDNFTTYDDTDPSSGVVLTFPYNGGYLNTTDNTTDASTYSRYILEFEFICDDDGSSKSQFDSIRNDFSNKLIIATVTSSNSCPNKYLSKLSYFFTKYKIVFLILFLVLGAFVAFFGLQMLKYTIFIIGAIAGTLVSALILFNFVHYSSASYVYWLIFAVCLIIGCVVGYVAVKIETLGFVVLGAVLGVTCGLMLYTAVLAPAKAGAAAYWVTIILAGIVGALLAFKFWKNVVIIATSILGAFMIVKAIGAATNTFPSEDSIASGVEGFTPVVYGYLVGIAVIAVAGIYYQHKKKKEAEFEKDQAEEDVHGYQRVMAYNP